MTFIGWMMPYCYATSLAPIVYDGMPWVKNIKVKPVKHFLSLINNSIKYIYTLSTQCVGAIAVPDFLVFAEYFIRKDFGEEWYENESSVNLVSQLFQHWIYSVNDKARGNQSAFTNVSVFDKYWREGMFGEHINPDFTKCNLDNLKRVQRLFVSVLIKEQEDNPFTFPVMTACQLKDKETGEIMDKDWLDWIGELSVKNKLMNFYTSDTCDSLSSCCRLRNNISAIKKDSNVQEYTNSFGVGGLNIGSHRVVCINLPQIAYIAKYSDKNDKQAFYTILESRIKVAQDILDIHRELLMRLIDNGNLPMYTYGCMDLSKQYSTLGFIGLYECLEILGMDINTVEGTNEAKEIIGLFNKLNSDRTAKDGRIRNVEQIPGESAAVTFCLKDKLQFANTNNYDLYANQYIPLIKEALMTDRIKLQGEFDSSVSGGSILHIDIDQELTKEQIIRIIQLCAKKNVVYFALDDCLSQCTSCGKVYVGKFEKSPCHNAATKKYMRVVRIQNSCKFLDAST